MGTSRESSGGKRQAGVVAVMVAMLLPILIGMAAIAVDLGHVYLVRNQLQNGADAAAMAGARTLDGTAGKLAQAVLQAQNFAAAHLANGSPIALQGNLSNDPAGDIVLGHWHPEGTPPWFEVAADPSLVPAWVNAVRVHAHRTAATGDAVKSFLAQVIGVASADVAATAVAVGGGPVAACSFPIAIPDCVLQLGSSSGTLQCGRTLSFNNNLVDNAGLTNLQDAAPVSANVVRQLIDDARNGICHAPTSGSNIYVQNGNDIVPIANTIRQWITANGGPITVTIPVLDTGTGGAGCSVQFNQALPIEGFAKIQIVSVAPPGGTGGNTINIIFLCDQTETAPAGGAFFGDRASEVYVTQ